MTTNPSNLVLDIAGVRKGTWVLTPLNPPAGECATAATPLNPPACGGRLPGGGELPGVGRLPGGENRADERPLFSLPACGEGRGGVSSLTAVGLAPIEDIQPGDMVYAHDGKPHSVVRATCRQYCGWMIGISHAKSSETLWLTENHLVLSSRRVQSLSPHGKWTGIPASHVEYARENRRAATPPEVRLWQRLRGSPGGISFRRQHQIGPYIADFYCRQAGMVIEVDGCEVHSGDEAVDYDRQRDAFMQSMGLQVMRFAARDVISRVDEVVQAISHGARELVLPEDPQKQWRYAGNLKVGDRLYAGADEQPVGITRIVQEQTTEDVYDLEVDHSFLTGVCAIHTTG